eukprot:15444867-Alexandrium_andersonii.AAC.1
MWLRADMFHGRNRSRRGLIMLGTLSPGVTGLATERLQGGTRWGRNLRNGTRTGQTVTVLVMANCPVRS